MHNTDHIDSRDEIEGNEAIMGNFFGILSKTLHRHVFYISETIIYA